MHRLGHNGGIAREVSHFWRNFLIAFVLTALLAVPCAVWMVTGALGAVSGASDWVELKEVKLSFEGQAAMLTGEVSKPALIAEAENYAEAKIRAAGAVWAGNFYPATSLQKDITVKPGFLMLVRLKGKGMLAGQTADHAELEKIIAAASPLLPERPDTLLLHSAEERGQAKQLETTLNALGSLVPGFDVTVPTLLLASLGGGIEKWDAHQSDTELQAQFLHRGWPWDLGQPVIQQLRSWAAEAAEEDRRMALPLPHLALMEAGKDVFLRGQVASQELKDTILAAAKIVYAERNLVEEITLNEERRPLSEAGRTLTTFPPPVDEKANGVLAFVIPGDGWKVKEIPAEGIQVQAMAELKIVPESFDLSLAKADFDSFAERHAAHRQSMKEQTEQLPLSFVALLAAGNQIVLRGELPSEATKKSLIEAAKLAYPPPQELIDEIRLNPERRPVSKEELIAYTTDLPPPPTAASHGELGFAVPGKHWVNVEIPPIELRVEEFEEFVRLKLLPHTFPEADCQPDFATFSNRIEEQAKRAASMKLSQAPPQPYLALLALGKQIFLRGDAGSEQLKKSVVDAAKAFYRDREVIDELRVDSNPPVVIKPLFTIKTFPPAPHLNGPGIFGFNLPGQPWLQVPLTWEEPKLADLQTAGLFSKVFESSQAWPDYQAWLPKLAERHPPPSPSKPTKP